MQANRMVNVTTMMFADQLRGTPFLVWWFRALVRLALLVHQSSGVYCCVWGCPFIMLSHAYYC